MHPTLRWFVLLAILCSSILSFAQTPQNTSDANKKFNIANAFYADKKYADAIPYYQEAYNLSKKAVILFNLGQCHRLLNDVPKAIDFYQRFLSEALAKEATEAQTQARQFIQELTPLLTPASALSNTPEPQPKNLASTLHYAAPAGVAVVGVGLGLILGQRALSFRKQAVDPLSDSGVIETLNENKVGRKLARRSDLATLGGLAVAGAVFLVTRPKKVQDKVSVSVGLTHLSAQLSF